jgi:hypothetical protein
LDVLIVGLKQVQLINRVDRLYPLQVISALCTSLSSAMSIEPIDLAVHLGDDVASVGAVGGVRVGRDRRD